MGATIAGLVSAVLVTMIGRLRQVDIDAALAVTVGAFFSVGVIVVSSQTSYTSDLTALLFGRILTVDNREVLDTLIVTVVVLVVLAALHKELILAAFDPTGAEALGFRVGALDLVLNVVIALVVVASLRAVGTVLVIALVVVPAATARLVTRSVGRLMIGSVAVAAVCGYLGLAASYEASVYHDVRLGSGATIVVTLTVAFALVSAATALGAGDPSSLRWIAICGIAICGIAIRRRTGRAIQQ